MKELSQREYKKIYKRLEDSAKRIGKRKGNLFSSFFLTRRFLWHEIVHKPIIIDHFTAHSCFHPKFEQRKCVCLAQINKDVLKSMNHIPEAIRQEKTKFQLGEFGNRRYFLDVHKQGKCKWAIFREEMESYKEKNKAIIALKEIKKYNHIKNDLEAYLFDVAEWGLGLQKNKPKLKEHRVHDEFDKN